ncbi:MAG: hypothetical protein H8E29_01690 [Anaerolineales bacterium]|uniref:Nal1 N-terminal domain-containing protein n=1 Tax=Candidatus Desulfolinea nitratireducens TaxID=2841698 RepID=A0A8J6NFY5_9CHLR|nr:hypothetical protein [Candidatus Desulfolinea nitratireducens]
MTDNSTLLEKAKSVKRAHEATLLAKPNVVGVGIGFRIQNEMSTENIAIVVMVSRKLPDSEIQPADRIPTEIEGVPVDVQESGEFYAQ